MSTVPKVILIDGSALLYRAFYAIPGNFSTTDGLPTNAIYGFALMFKKLAMRRDASFGAVVFDAPGGTFRDKLYAEYKSHRPKMPSDLREQLPYIDELVEAHNFPILRVEGYEADDVIGTLAVEAESDGCEVLIVSGDKDFAQLISPRVKMSDTFRDIHYDEELVRKKWGVMPSQFVDYLALVGDKADNIPGVAGIGAKGAAKLLETYGSLDGVLGAAGELKGRQKTSLLASEKEARLSRELALIDRKVPLDRGYKELPLVAPPQDALNALYRELEFFSLLEKAEGDVSHKKADQNFVRLENGTALAEYLAANAERQVAVAPIVEDSGECVGLAFAAEKGRGVYAAVAGGQADGALREALQEFFTDPQCSLVVHGSKPLLKLLRGMNIALAAEVFDTKLASFLINPNQLIPHDIGRVYKWYCHSTVEPPKTILGSGKSKKKYGDVDVDELSDYACHLAAAITEMSGPIAEKLAYEDQMSNLLDVDLPLAHVLADMELQGILVDAQDLNDAGVEFKTKLAALADTIYKHAGSTFNINSTKQLSKVLFEDLELPVIKRTKSGYSTKAEVLERLRDKHPIAAALLEYRKLNKLINTYTDVLQKAVDPKTGRVHATFQQTAGVTGRLISTNPDLQRTPIRTEEGKRIRRAFVAPSGHSIISADWSQIELRILADQSRDPNLMEAFLANLDVHTRTAAEVFGKATKDVTPEERNAGKTINFATIYGQGATALGQQLRIKRNEAKKYIEQYFKAYAGVRTWLDGTIAEAMETGYVQTLLGRRRYIPELSSNSFMEVQAGQRIAANTPIQGTAADICKLAMLRIAKELTAASLSAKMTLQIHDELLFECPDDEVDAVSKLVKDAMESVVELSVPLIATVGVGSSWAAAK